MKAIIKILQKKHSNNFNVQLNITEGYLCEYFGNNSMMLKKENDVLILKIRLRRKYQFSRIIFKKIAHSIWFGKSPNSEDFILINQLDNLKSFEIYIFPKQWKYRLLILGIIQMNNKIDCIYNKLI